MPKKAKKLKKSAKKKKRVAVKHKKKIILAKKTVPAAKPQEEIQLKRTKIRVFGIGGGGSSIISEIASRVKKASFVAVNTDRKALGEVNRNVIRFQFGENFTHGLGTGMNAEIGEAAALSEKDRIKKLFEGQDLCIFVSCLGGGTGSGATKVLTKIAKSAGCLTFGIFTLPFNFEGENKAFIARKALEELRQKLHAFAVIPNERIFQIIQKETPLRAALSAINSKLADSLEGLIEVIYEPGLINIDFADLKAVLEGQGKLTYLNTVEVKKKEGAVQEEINMLLNSPLYPYGIKGARGVLYNIAGEKGLSLADVSQISRNISDLVNKEAKIIFGISQNSKHGKSIKTTLLAAGCGTKILAEQNLEAKPKITKKQETKSAKKTKKRKRPVFAKAVTGKTESDTGKKNKSAGVKNQKPKTKKVNPKSKISGKTKVNKEKKNKIKIKSRPKRKIKVRLIQDNIPQEATAPLFPEEKTAARASSGQAVSNGRQAKVRKNAVQIKAEADRAEEEMLAREKAWETPAFLRRKKII